MRLTVALPLAVMYGYVPTSFADPAIQATNQSIIRGGVKLLPGASAANLARPLAWLMTATNLPFIGLKREMDEIKELVRQAKHIPFEDLKRRTASPHSHNTVSSD